MEYAGWVDFLLQTNKWGGQKGSNMVPNWFRKVFLKKNIPDKRGPWKIFQIK